MVDVQAIFSIKDEVQFEKEAISIFHFQRENCLVYKEYVSLLNRPEPTCLAEIPFLPISFLEPIRLSQKIKSLKLFLKVAEQRIVNEVNTW